MGLIYTLGKISSVLDPFAQFNVQKDVEGFKEAVHYLSQELSWLMFNELVVPLHESSFQEWVVDGTQRCYEGLKYPCKYKRPTTKKSRHIIYSCDGISKIWRDVVVT